jgi:hypothetical protein
MGSTVFPVEGPFDPSEIARIRHFNQEMALRSLSSDGGIIY